MSKDSSSFLIKRLMSLTGMLPVGGFLVQHFFSNAYIFISPEAYNSHTAFLTSFPLVVGIELALIYFPILLHAALGIAIIYRGQNNFTTYSEFRNWMFFLQRATGLIALIFIATHAYTTRISTFIAGKEISAASMSRILQQPAWFWFYVVGVVAVVFHFANGLWSFLITWGITIGPKAQKVSASLTMALFVVMSLFGIAILLRFT